MARNKSKKKWLTHTAGLTLATYLAMEAIRFSICFPVALAQEEQPTKRVAIFVLPSSDSEGKAALLMGRVLRDGLTGLTGSELVAPAPVANSSALPDLEKQIGDAYIDLNGKRVQEAMAKLIRAKPLLEQLLPIVPIRTVALFYKAYGVGQVLSGNMAEARSALEISLLLWKEQNNLEYAYSVEALKLYTSVSADLERRPSARLVINTTPENAVVVVDSREPMQSPATITNLTSGQHLVKAVMDGHEQWAGFVLVKPGDENTVTIPLKPIAEKAVFDQRLVAVAKVMKKNAEVASESLANLKQFLGADELLALETSVVGETFELKGFHIKGDNTVFPVKRSLARDASFLAGVREFLSGLFESFYELSKKTEGLGGPPIDPVILQKAGITAQQTATVFDPDNPVFPKVDLKGKDKDTIFDKWWFWVGVGVVVAGGAAGVYALATSDAGASGPTGCIEINIVPVDQ